MEIVIEYCRICNYGARALAVADEILIHFEQVVSSLKLVPSRGGAFEVLVDGELIYSKLETKRHMRPGEVVLLLKSRAEVAEQIERLGY